MKLIKFVNATQYRLAVKIDGIIRSMPTGATIEVSPERAYKARAYGLTEVK